MLARYRGKNSCPECSGSKLRKEALYVQVGGKTINDLVNQPLDDLLSFVNNLSLSKADQLISERILTEITDRLGFLNEVGLGYLTLNRLSSTLSGGVSKNQLGHFFGKQSSRIHVYFG